MSNSLDTYTLETPTVLWSPISLASLCASSTGCTLALKARPKPPSTRPSSFFSIPLKMFIVAFLGHVAARQSQRQDYHAGGEHHIQQQWGKRRRVSPDADRYDAIRGEGRGESQRPDPEAHLQPPAGEGEADGCGELCPHQHLQQTGRSPDGGQSVRRRAQRVAGGGEAVSETRTGLVQGEGTPGNAHDEEVGERGGAGPGSGKRAAHAAQHLSLIHISEPTRRTPI